MYLTEDEKLLFSTVRLECDPSPEPQAYGTGFHVELRRGEVFAAGIVTTWHTLETTKFLRLTLTKRSDRGDPLLREHVVTIIEEPARLVQRHPDPGTDLCLLPLDVVLQSLPPADRQIYYRAVPAEWIAPPELVTMLRAVEEVLMVGYPVGIADVENNLPIIRRGTTASHPSIPYRGTRQFLVDLACAPGSSGSPVFLFDTWGHIDKAENVKVAIRRRALLGIFRGALSYTAEGTVEVVDVPADTRAIARSEIPTLGAVVQADRLWEFLPPQEVS